MRAAPHCPEWLSGAEPWCVRARMLAVCRPGCTARSLFCAACCPAPTSPQDCHKGLPGFLQFAGDMRLGSSLVDGQPTWLIDYTDAEPLVGHDFRGFTDELREVAGWLDGWLDGWMDGWMDWLFFRCQLARPCKAHMLTN